MIILGVTHPISWNNAACLLVDGKLIAFAEEERFVRLKHAPRMFPKRAVDFCLQKGGISYSDINATAIGFAPPTVEGLTSENAKGYIQGTLSPERYSHLATDMALLYNDMQTPSWGQRLYFDHHLAHAASTAIPSGFASANIISLDGWGGKAAGLIGYYKERGELVVDRWVDPHQSWGVVYELVTASLGFQPHSGEGKTMGLAPYGKVDCELLPDFCDQELGLPNKDKFAAYLSAHVKVRKGQEPIEQIHKNLAATLQQYYERSLIKIARYLSRKSGLNRYVLAGGVALNCTGNGALAKQDFVEDVFIQPASHDGGTALGAAILAHRQLTGSWPGLLFENAYWGPDFTQDQIRAALKFSGVPFKECDPAIAAAQALEQNKLLGFFQGRAEVGPRALGNRSILAHPGEADNHRRVNLLVKRREPWRPFAPSVMKEHYRELFDARIDSPFMIMAFQASEKWKHRIPAVVHVDGSCRPQSVSEHSNLIYYRMLEQFRKLTGFPVVLNTSFNLEDEPIVNAPDHAIASFFRSGLEVLVMGNFVVRKSDVATD